MKKITFLKSSLPALFLLTLLFVPPLQALADVPPSGATTFTLQNPLKVDSVGGLISTFVQVFSYLVILFAVLMLIWTGLQYILARGNPERMKELTGRLGWILIGIAVVVGAGVLVTLVINTLQATGTINPQVMQSVQTAASGH